MFGRTGDTYKRKTKIKKDVGSSGDEGGQFHERTRIKQKRHNVKGSHVIGTVPTVVPVTTGTTRMRGRNRGSSSSSSSSDNQQRNIGTTNVVTPVGFGSTTGYNQTYQPTTMTHPMTTPPLDSFNQTTRKKIEKPGFVEKIKYKLRSRR